MCPLQQLHTGIVAQRTWVTENPLDTSMRKAPRLLFPNSLT
jgi:hypothetical protein